MSYRTQYWLIRATAFLFGFIPVSFAGWCGRRAGDFIFYCFPGRRRIAIANIRKAFGVSLPVRKMRVIARKAFQNMAVSFIELFMIKKIKHSMKKRFTVQGSEHLDAAYAQGKGVVLVVSHLGSWEYLSFLPLFVGNALSVIVRKIRNPYLDKYIGSLRRLTTITPISKMNSIRTAFQELKKNHGVAILIDQWAGSEGVWLDFFKERTSTTSIPSRLAKRTECALIPAYCVRKSFGHYEIQIHPQVIPDPQVENWEQATTSKLNDLLETQIKKYPEQWLWGHRRWKKKPTHVRNLLTPPVPLVPVG